MMNELDLDMNRLRLLNLNYREMDTNVIFCRSLNKMGGCLTLSWSDNDKVASAIKILGFNPESKRHQAEFVVSPKPLVDGYFTLIAVKVMPESNGQEGASLEEFIANFMKSEWRRIGINFEYLDQKPNGGKRVAGFIFGEKNGLLLVASTWVPA